MDLETAGDWAKILAAAAHPTRLMIMAELLNGTKCVNKMQEILAIPQPNVSRHLKELRYSGLVAFYQDGASRCYYLTRPSLVREMFAFLERDHPAVEPTL